MQKYECNLCGYIYVPEKNNNTDFKNLPDDWVCPICSAKKDEFREVS